VLYICQKDAKTIAGEFGRCVTSLSNCMVSHTKVILMQASLYGILNFFIMEQTNKLRGP
jgi:hypothetical protein